MKKLIQLIDKFDGPQSTLSNEEFFIREKLLLYLKLFWVFSIVIFVLLGIIVSISYFFYFFYYAIILWIITKVLDMLLIFTWTKSLEGAILLLQGFHFSLSNCCFKFNFLNFKVNSLFLNCLFKILNKNTSIIINLNI